MGLFLTNLIFKEPPLLSNSPFQGGYLFVQSPCFDLLEHEGFCLGPSTGINVAGAIRLAKELGPGHTIVTLLCDGGHRYQSKAYNPEFLRKMKLPLPPWLT